MRQKGWYVHVCVSVYGKEKASEDCNKTKSQAIRWGLLGEISSMENHTVYILVCLMYDHFNWIQLVFIIFHLTAFIASN